MFSSSRSAGLAAVVVAFCAAGCATPDRPPPAPSAAPPPPSATTTPPPPVAATVDEACLSERPFSPNGPRYSGPGPHPIVIDFADVPDVYPGARSNDSAARISRSLPVVIASFGNARPEGWTVPYENDDPRLKETVQLLVCVVPSAETVSVSGDGPTLECEFIGGDVPFRIVGGEYRVHVLEARSGAVVGRFTVPANQAPDTDDCPTFVSFPQGERLGVFLLGLDGTAFENQLRPYVTDPR